MLVTHIETPAKLALYLDAMHDQCGARDVETVRGGTQINLKDCGLKLFCKLLRQFPHHERITGIWSTRIGVGGYHIQHVHPHGDTSGVYYVRVGDGGNLTIGDETIVPTEGMFVEFNSRLPHGTTPYRGVLPRLTIAYDKQ